MKQSLLLSAYRRQVIPHCLKLDRQAAVRALSLAPRESRQQHGRQNAEDGDYDQKFEESERPRTTRS